jgi:chromosome segregation ATPase
VEQFTVLSNVDKLRMVEAAVGLEPFRENVLQAQHKLTRILSQEESVGKLLESAESTLNFWREQYEKYQEKKQLQTRRRFLDRELMWAEVERRENAFKALQNDRDRAQEILKKIEEETEATSDDLKEAQDQQEKLKEDFRAVFDERLSLGREIAENESTSSLIQKILKEFPIIESALQKNSSQLKLLRPENLTAMMNGSREKVLKLDEQMNKNQGILTSVEDGLEKVEGQILENRVQLALLGYRKTLAAEDLDRAGSQLKDAKTSLDSAVLKAEQSGARIAVLKSVSEIVDEIRLTDGHLAALADVSEDIERMYESYSALYLELKEKAQVVAENRSKALEEVKTRMLTWRSVIQNLLDRVNLEYQKIMGKTLATGEVRLANGQDIETAGLEILVGFKGGKPVALDAHTQSGGERTTATMSFLLALQQHVRSPFRAVDEYDIHMDPKNREMIARMLVSLISDSTAQYIVITPSQITFAQENANIITVQNVEGQSIVREVS